MPVASARISRRKPRADQAANLAISARPPVIPPTVSATMAIPVASHCHLQVVRSTFVGRSFIRSRIFALVPRISSRSRRTYSICVSSPDDLGRYWQQILQSGGNFGNLIRSEEHTSELQSLMRNSYAVFCLKKQTNNNTNQPNKYIT